MSRSNSPSARRSKWMKLDCKDRTISMKRLTAADMVLNRRNQDLILNVDATNSLPASLPSTV